MLPHCGGVWVEGYESSSEFKEPLIEVKQEDIEKDERLLANVKREDIKTELIDNAKTEVNQEVKMEANVDVMNQMNSFNSSVCNTSLPGVVDYLDSKLSNGDISDVIAMDSDICEVSPMKVLKQRQLNQMCERNNPRHLELCKVQRNIDDRQVECEDQRLMEEARDTQSKHDNRY